MYEFGSELPESAAWLETLAGPRLTWLRALVCSKTIVQGTSYIDNPIRRLLLDPSQKVVISLINSLPSSVTVFGAARSFGGHDKDFKAVEINRFRF